MTESPASPALDPPARHLHEAYRRFVDLWGRMAASWGIPRTMAEMHALLFVTGRPMNADEVMEQLGISRGNASTTLRRLEEWGLVFRHHRRGDRKEYFTAEQDPWTVFRTVLRERKRREVDPLVDALRACRAETDGGGDPEVNAHNERLDRLVEFIELLDAIARHFVEAPEADARSTARELAESIEEGPR